MDSRILKKASSVGKFLSLVSRRYGNPKAVFGKDGDNLEYGQRVLVLPRKGEYCVFGKVVHGKGKRKAIRYVLDDRTWFVPVSKCQFLVRW